MAALRLAARYEVICNSKDEAAWLEARKHYVTATDAGVVIGKNPWMGPFELYHRKVDTDGVPDVNVSEVMRMGLKMEPAILGLFKDESGLEAVPCGDLMQSMECRWLAATMDGWVTDDLGTVTLELKNVSVHQLSKWKDGPPEHYVPQLEAQMIVAGTDRCYIAALVGGQAFRWHRYESDPALRSYIVDATREFWKRVMERRPPDPDGTTESEEGVVRAVAGTPNRGEWITLDSSWEEVDNEIQSLGSEIGRLVAQKKALRHRLELAMGTATEARIEGVGGVKWQRSRFEKKAYSVPAKTVSTLRRAKS